MEIITESDILRKIEHTTINPIQLRETEGGPQIATKSPLVSIIIPTYCEEKNIERCLKSVKKQKFEKGKIEIVVVDSNSPDNTKSIAKKYTDKVVNIENRGISQARNTGFKVSRGEIVVFIDADTFFHPACIMKILEEFKSKIVVCVHPTILTYDGDLLGNIVHRIFGHYLVKVLLLFGKPLFPICAAYRREVLEKVNGFNEKITVGEDLDLSLRVSKFGKCVFTNKAIAFTSLRRFEKSGLLPSLLFQLYCYIKLFLLNRPHVTIYHHTEEQESIVEVLRRIDYH